MIKNLLSKSIAANSQVGRGREFYWQQQQKKKKKKKNKSRLKITKAKFLIAQYLSKEGSSIRYCWCKTNSHRLSFISE